MTTENEEMEVIEQDDGSLHVTDPKDIIEDSGDDNGDDDSRNIQSEEASDDEDERPNARTEENRRKRQGRMQRINARTDKLRNELAARDALIADLTSRVQQQERKTSGTEMAQLDGEIRKAADAYKYFKGQIANAHGQPDGGHIVADATEKMVLASRRYEELNSIKKRVISNQNQPPAIDPVLLNHGKAWIEKHSWYDPSSGDEDSQIALVVDNALVREGWNPRTPEYWDELDRRLEKRLPNRFKRAYNDANENRSHSRPRSVVTGSGRETSGSGGNAGFTLSADRVKAIKDSGGWDDPKQRADAIRRYREYDKQQQQA